MSDNGNHGGDKTYVVRVELVMPGGETAAVCEGEVKVPAAEDVISLDDLLEAVKTYDLWEDGDIPYDEIMSVQ